MSDKTCDECKGLGWLVLPADADPTDEEICPSCGGTGRD